MRARRQSRGTVRHGRLVNAVVLGALTGGGGGGIVFPIVLIPTYACRAHSWSIYR